MLIELWLNSCSLNAVLGFLGKFILTQEIHHAEIVNDTSNSSVDNEHYFLT